MTATLHITESDDIPAETIKAFESLARQQGKTSEQLLAEVITAKVESAKTTRPHPYQNSNA
jgi:predicted DNA-binding protein